MFDDFEGAFDARWTQTYTGGGSLSIGNSLLRMEMPGAQKGRYTNAQIDDYDHLPRSAFPWKPPLRIRVRARSSLPAAGPGDTQTSRAILHGTAGFGLWNLPLSLRSPIPVLPESIWFFYASPPSNMALVPGVPGWGWKAQVVHSMRADALAAVVPTALTTGWGLVTGDTRPAARWLQRLSGTSEALIRVDMMQWHNYVLEWRASEALFQVDEALVLRVPRPPTRSLGFVAWLDNQYAVATPRGVLRFGTVNSGPQWFELDSVSIEPLTDK